MTDTDNTSRAEESHPAMRVSGDRLPPHCEQSEAIVLGTILHFPEQVVEDIAKMEINRRSFYDLRHQVIYDAINMVLREGQQPDSITVTNRIKAEGKLQEAGGLSYIAGLPDSAPVLFKQYATALQELRLRRELIKNARSIEQRIHDPLEKLDDIRHDMLRVVETTRSATERLTVRRPDEILAMAFDEHDCYMGDRIIAAGQSTTILGPGGIGKSRLLLQLAAACITGREFLGMPTHAMDKRWLILQAENSNRRLRSDLEHLREWIGEEDWKKVCDKLVVHTLETDSDSILCLNTPGVAAGIEHVVSVQAPDIVAIDALYNFAGGDLNNDAEMRNVLQTLSRLLRSGNPQRAIVVLHHALTGKMGVGKAVGFDRASYGRNSKVLHAWTRAQINIALGSAEDNSSLIVTCGKNNNGKEFPRFAVKLNPDKMIYEANPDFDWTEWQQQVQAAGMLDTVTPAQVRDICREPMAKADLAKAIMAGTGCYRGSAYRFIQRAEENGAIRFNESDEMYLAC